MHVWAGCIQVISISIGMKQIQERIGGSAG